MNVLELEADVDLPLVLAVQDQGYRSGRCTLLSIPPPERPAHSVLPSLAGDPDTEYPGYVWVPFPIGLDAPSLASCLESKGMEMLARFSLKFSTSFPIPLALVFTHCYP